jgi:D-allose transport system substrate-binding protein
MALGAVEAAYAAGKGEDILIIGVDGNVDAVKSIKSGRLNASVAQLPYLVGKQAVETVTQVLDGAEVEKFQFVPTLVLTQEVLEKGEEPMLEFVR